jgi:hypothetical protein
MKPILALCAALALGACASLNISQTAEKVDTDASAAYIAVASGVNTYIAANPSQAAAGQALELKAWSYYAAEHAVYKSGGVGDITALVALVQCIQTKGVGACL